LFIFNHDQKFNFFCLLIFLVGFFSDLFILKKPLTKFILQLIAILSFLFFYDLKIISTKIIFIDYFLENKIFAILFTLFCLLILINGSNFIDGVNTLLCGYYLLVLSVIFYITSHNSISNFSIIDLKEFLLILLMIYSFNFFSKLYLGDSGAFLISFIIGYYLINITNNNPIISPLFIVLLLWYPAFENLFSIFRKFCDKSHPSNPDNFHLHHLLFSYLKVKMNNKKIVNSLTGTILNFYNLIIFFIGAQFYNNTNFLVILVIINISVYIFSYFYLLRKN
jgi:UDP-N-acetylmuramyl pentapeptide phosphotransferase/UDP-N-acetylglucosamine-1-phosphate transferase